MTKESVRGITFQISIGKSGGFHFEVTKHFVRIVLLWISFAAYLYDLDRLLGLLLNKLRSETKE